jgi:hypothetical protein
MGNGFEFDERAFRREIERAADDAIKKTIADEQKTLDKVARRSSGKSTDQVLAELKRENRRTGGRASDKDLRPLADAIAKGQKVKLKQGRTKW